MDEDLSIFNVTYDSLVQQQDEIRFPKINQKRIRSTNKKTTKRSLKIGSPLKLDPEDLYAQSFPSRRSANKSHLHEYNGLNSTVSNWNHSSLGFTPKIKRLFKVAPIAEKMPNSPRSISAPSKPELKLVTSQNLIDWKESTLETYIVSNKCEFNWENDPSLLSEYQIKQLKVVGHGYVLKTCLKNTLKTLCNELMQSEFYVEKLTDTQLLAACKFLFTVRELTLEILKLIHEREYLLLRMITDSDQDLVAYQQRFMQITFSIIDKIKIWKKFRISRQKFTYIGQNYMRKIYNDLALLENAYHD